MATQIGQLKYSVGFDVKKQDLNALKTQLQQLSNFKISDLMQFNNSDRENAKKALNDIRNEAEHVKDALSAAFNAKLDTINIETFNKSLKQSGSSLQQVYNAFKQGGAAGQNAFRNLVTQVTTTNTQLKETHKFLDNIATTLGNTIKWNIASTAVNALSNSVQQAWGFVKNLDTSLNDIMIVTGKSADEMAKFSEQANEAAKSLGKTTVDYAKAALIYAQQGLSDDEIAARAAITLKTANVTGQSTDQVSEELTSVWNGYKVNAEQAELYIDRLAAVAASTASDLEELSTGMSKVAAAAAAMGVGEDQLAAQLSTIISVTRQAPESVGTALRTVYARISDIKAGIDEDGVDLGRYSGKMAELGFNVLDVNGKLRDMGQVIEEIGGRWQGLTREQQVSLAQTMAGQRQYSNLIALFDNFEEYNRALGIAQNAAGTLQKQQDTYMESTRAHLNQLKAATEQLYMSLVNPDTLEPLIDALASAASMGAKFINSLGGGENLLLSLSGIAVNVFSDQLTKGVQTFVHNFSLGNQQVELMKQNLATFDQVLNIQGLDERSKAITESFKQTELSLAKRATPEQFKQMNNILGSVTASVNEYNETLVETRKLEQQFQEAQKVTGTSYKNMYQYLGKTAEQHDKFDEILYSSSIGYERAAAAAEQFSKAVVQQNGSIEVTQNEINALKQALQSISDKDFSISGFERPKQEIDNVLKALQQIQKKDFDDSKYKEFVDKIQKHFQRLKDVTQITTTAIEQQTNNQSQAAKKLERNVSNAGEGLKNIGNQERIRAVGRLVGSFTQLATSVKITANAFNELKNGNIGSGLAALATSLTSVTTAAISAGKAVSALGASIGLASGIGVAVAAISLVVSGLISWKQAADQARQAQIELNNTAIENQHKNQEQIDKKQQLLQAVKDLNEEYENGQITRADLRSEIEKLCDQYGIEEGYIDNLINKYGDLAQGIRQARIEAAKEKQESLQNQFQTAKENVEKVKLKSSYAGLLTNYADSYFADILASNGARFANPEVLQTGGINAGFLELPTDLEDKINLYNDLTTELQKHSSDLLFDILKKWYDDFSAAADEYNQVKEQIDSYLDYDIYSNQYADFDKTKSFEEYRKQREQLINNVVKNDADKIDQVTRAVDKYLKSNYKGLYNQYDEVLNYVDELESRLGKIDGKILESIQELDAAHLDELQRRKVDTWEEFKDTLEQVSQLDLSNVQNLVNANPEDLSQIASDRYTFFQSLQDQVKSGKSISSKEIERFANYGASQLQEYFTMMANGQYQMTEDAKEFNEVVNNLKLTGFFDVIDTLQKKAQQLEKFNEYLNKFDNATTGQNDFDYERLNQEAMTSVRKSSQFYVDRNTKRAEAAPSTNRQWVETTFDHDLIKDQLEYLQNFKQIDAETSKNIQNWKELNEVHYADKQMVSDIADAVRRVKDQSETFNDDVNYVNQKLKQTQHQIYKILFPTDVDVKETALSQLSTTLQQLSTESEELSEDLQDNLYVAEQVAEAILRFDDAIQDVVDHYDDWLLALQQETLSLQDQAELFPQLRDAYADMLDIDGSLLSDEFLASTQNLEWMKAAIDGDIQAYDNLAEAARVAALQMLKIDPSIDMSHFEEDLAYLKNYLNNRENFPDLEIGAELNDQKFLEELSNMLNIMGVSAAQASDILRQNLGIDTEIIEVKDTVKQTQQFPVTNAVLEQVQDNGYVTVPVSTGRGFGTQRLNLPHKVFSTKYQPDVETIETTKQGSSFALKVTSANKSAGGHFKYTHASRGAGSIGTARRKAAAEKAAKTAKSNTDTSTKETKKPAEDNRDIYHDINLQLESITRQLNRVQKVQDKLFGKQLIANLNKQSDILEKHKVKLREKQELQKKDLAQKAEQLRLLGVIVNTQTGNIDNYLDALGQRQGIINGLIEQYNGIVGNYNATTDKDAKDAIKDQLTEVERAIKDAETDYKNLETKIKNYDALRKAYEDIADAIEEQTQKQIEIQITKFRMSVEISLEMGDAQREWNKFKREVLKADDVLKDSDFEKIIRDAQYYYNDIESYFTGSESVQQLTDKITDATERLKEWNEQGDDIYGDRKKQLIDNLKGDLSTLQGQMESIVGLMQDIDQAVIDTTNDIKNQMDEQLEDYEFVSDRIQYQIDLLQLLYGEKQYDAMDSYYERLEQNQLQEIDFLRKSIDTVKQRWMAARENGDEQYARQLEQIYQDLYKKMDGLVAEHAKTLQDEYTNAINGIFDAFDKRITNGLGLEYVEMEWELINKNADEYLDAINSAYALQDLERKYQKAITDNNTSVKNQRILTNLMNEQLDHLRDKEKLTQYDVERAEKLLQIEQARMALEDQKNAKTSLRLKRDSQGNYSYVYSANQDDILAAEENLAKLQNELYNFDKDTYKDNLNDILSAYKDFETRAAEIAIKYKDDEETRTRQLAKLREEYEEYISNKIIENTQIRSNLANSAFAEYSELYGQNYEDFKNMSDQELDVFLGQLVVGWNNGVQQMIFAFNGPDGLEAQVDEVFNNLQAATEEYKNKLITAGDTAGVVFEQLREGAIDPTIDEFSNLIDKNDDLIEKFNIQLEKIDALKRELTTLMGIYKQVWKDAQDAIDAGNKVLQQKYQQAKDIAKQEAETKPVTPEQQPQNLPAAPQTITPASVSTGGGTGTGSSTGTSKSGNNLPYWPTDKPSQTLEGIAGSIWLFGSKPFSWNNQPDRENKLIQVFGPSGAKMYDKVQNMFNVDRYGYEYLPSHGIDYDYYMQWTYEEQKKKKNKPVTAMDTGGYTGAWGPQGRLAVLHQKELVLNAQDTKNMLDSVEVLRGIVTNLGGSISARLNGLNGGYAGVTPSQTSDQIDQNVSIQANFPNVNSKREIEEAFSELVNLAAQRALRRT